MYFNRGSLPWQGLRAKTKKEKYEAIKEKKVSTSIESLCKGYPDEFATYLNYCHKLGFDEKPDYGLLRKLFKDLYIRKGFECDYIYDWNIIKAPSAHKPALPGLDSSPQAQAQIPSKTDTSILLMKYAIFY